MPFQRFVQTGRVAYVNDGPSQGKLVAIVDIIDQNRVLVDGPHTKVPRQQMRLNDLHLTKFHIKFPFTASTRAVRKAWDWKEFEEKWSKTMWAGKIKAKKLRAQLSDFDRFKLRRARRIRNAIRSTVFYRLKRNDKKGPKKAKAVKATEESKEPAKTAKDSKKSKEAKK
ncbi:60S ribosomal protein L14 [Copidosoma floridanum]|uniref:60S ribosomal protein L14 n=1 Tax=Copidosoma floridanum TaxID=29053 RepID=UPI0006C9E134|nr:60S ribosomal protein L14 [Copidosoma floridanum]